MTKAEYLLLSQRGEALWQQGQAAEAERVFHELLARMEAGAAYDAAYDHAYTSWNLGRCLAAQGRPAQAIEWHRQALQEFERLSASDEDAKEMLGKVYTDLGDNLAAVGQFDEAQRAYESGLEISKEVGDHRSVGVKLGQLGKLALRRGDLAEAARRYSKALDTFRALGEPQMEAVAWHQLGIVAEEARQWDEAERCYREAVRIREHIGGEQHRMAEDFNQLAIVAKGAGRLDDAERWYLRAQEIKDQVSPHDASTLNNLAALYLSQGHLDEAARYAHRAVETVEQHHIQTEVWKMYGLLAQIAEARGQAGEAAQWRRKEQESYAAYAGAAHQLPRWAPAFIAAVVAAVQGNEAARRQVEELLPQLEEGGWDCPLAIRRILAGESDADALCVGLDYDEAYIVRTILAQLAGPALSAVEGEEPQTPRVSEAVARIRQQWAPVIGAVVAACQGNAQAATQLEPLLAQLSGQDDWRNLSSVIRRILSGERDPAALLPGLDATDTLIAGDILRALGVDVGSPPPHAGEGSGEGAMTLDDLLALVALACTSDAPPGLAKQLHAATRVMAADTDVPAELRALGRALNAVLSGDRAPDLSALPPELADKLRGMLAALQDE